MSQLSRPLSDPLFRVLRAAPWRVAIPLLLAGCAGVDMPSLPAQVPAAWSQAPAAGVPAPDPQGWWKALGDPQLDALVDEALAANLEIAQAASRLRQARLLSGDASDRFRPLLSANMRPVQDVQAIDSYLHASLDVSWELGLFGDRDGLEKVAQARLDGAAGGLQGARVTVVAEVVRRYVELRCAQQQALLADQLAALDARAADLSAVRLRTRLGSADDEAQARARLAQTLAQRAQPRYAAVRAAQALAVLTGRTAADAAWLQAPGTIPLPPAGALSPTQLPADLLRVRPDLQRAEAAVRKAAGEAGIAQADLYPHVSLGMSFLYSYNVTQHRRITTNNVPGIGPVIDIPLFDWGRRKAQAAAQREALDEALLAYRHAVLEGVAETETALSLLAEQRERAAQSQAALGLLSRRAAVQRGWAGAGLASDYDGLAGQRAGLMAAAELADAQAGHALALVALYKSLGGAPLQSEAQP